MSAKRSAGGAAARRRGTKKARTEGGASSADGGGGSRVLSSLRPEHLANPAAFRAFLHQDGDDDEDEDEMEGAGDGEEGLGARDKGKGKRQPSPDIATRHSGSSAAAISTGLTPAADMAGKATKRSRAAMEEDEEGEGDNDSSDESEADMDDEEEGEEEGAQEGDNPLLERFLAGRIKFTEMQTLLQQLHKAKRKGKEREKGAQAASVPAPAAAGSATAGVGEAAAATEESAAAPAAAARTRRLHDATTQDGVDFDEIMKLKRTGRKERGRSRTYKTKHDLDPMQAKKMGEANTAYARQEWDRAIELCKQVIKERRHAPDPYTTIGMVYMETNQPGPALRFKMMAALNLPDRDVNWRELGQLSRQQNELKQALYCYDRSARHDPDNLDALYERVHVQIEMKKYKRALDGYVHLLGFYPDNIQLCVEMHSLVQRPNLKSSLRKSLVQTALAALEKVAAEAKEAHSEKLLSILVDLLMVSGRYLDAIKLIESNLQHLQREGEAAKEQEKEALRQNAPPLVTSNQEARTLHGLDVPDTLRMRFRAKLGVAHLFVEGGKKHAFGVLNGVFESRINKDTYGAFVDAIEGLMAADCPQRALPVIDKVMAVAQFNKPTVWLLKAKCLLARGNTSAAEQLLIKIREVVPGLTEAQRLLKDLATKARQGDQPAKSGGKGRTSSQARSSDSSGSAPTAQRKRARPAERKRPLPAGIIIGAAAFTPTEMSTTATPYGLQGAERLAPGEAPKKEIFLEQLSNTVKHFRELLVADEQGAAQEIGSWLCTLLVMSFQEPKSQRSLTQELADTLELQGHDRVEYVQASIRSNHEMPCIVYSSCTDGLHVFDRSLLSTDDWVEVVVRTVELMLRFEHGEHALALTHRILKRGCLGASPQTLIRIQWLKALAAEACNDLDVAFAQLRAMCQDAPLSLRLWNLFFKVCKESKASGQNVHRFIQRLQKRVEGRCPSPMMIIGHHHLSSNVYSYAAGSYAEAIKEKPKEAVILLSCSIAYLRMVMQRKVKDRQLVVGQALTLVFKYFEAAGGLESAEACYNVGRAFHQLPIPSLAIDYYQKALACDKTEHDRAIHRHVAQNLAVIFQSSNQHALAAHYRRTYIQF